jgi:hypothetical protein
MLDSEVLAIEAKLYCSLYKYHNLYNKVDKCFFILQIDAEVTANIF